MQFSTTRSKVVSVSATLVVAAAGILGTAAATDGVVSDPANEVPTMEAPTYAGDPWEKRFRDQFWSTQHIHDSWNPCHIGENVPERLQGSGPDCWSRLPGHTDR